MKKVLFYILIDYFNEKQSLYRHIANHLIDYAFSRKDWHDEYRE